VQNELERGERRDGQDREDCGRDGGGAGIDVTKLRFGRKNSSDKFSSTNFGQISAHKLHYSSEYYGQNLVIFIAF
jgi:hypothetical protein